MANLASEYKDLCKQAAMLQRQLEDISNEMAFKRSALRKLVKVNDKFTTFTELEFNGRKLRVKYNSYGDCTVTENGKKVDTNYKKLGYVRPSINDLRLALATGRL